MIIHNLYDTPTLSEQVSSTSVYPDGKTEKETCQIVHEHSLELFINEQLVLKLVCTPSHLVELVVGRMISEGYIISTDDVDLIYICDLGKKAKVYLKDTASSSLNLTQSVTEEPTCCTDNQVFLQNANHKDLKLPKAVWNSDWIFQLANEFASGSKIHKATQGTHSCYLASKGTLLFVSEDIGRHNALDKAIGYAALHEYDPHTCILYTTGRVPTDMIKKMIRSRIPVLVSKSVPTDAAITMAHSYNLTLICKAWPDRYEIFHDANA